MKLEFPAFTSYDDRQRPEVKNWGNSIRSSISFGLLGDGVHFEQVTKAHTFIHEDKSKWGSVREPRRVTIPGSSDWRIPRDAYRNWRATQSNLPNGSMIHLWIGTVERESESKAQKTKLPSMFERRLESFMSYLNELEKAGDFDRNSIMEKKEELHDGLKKYDRKLWEIAFSTFEGFLKQAHKEIDFFIHSGPRPQKPS
ncbi:MAG: hypothetical protein F9K25_17325 [Candidatus Contendobacter sp.]|nr:MAG: hypothetical protein F9K25_17325 [Candidatus Contendobacter sp.]